MRALVNAPQPFRIAQVSPYPWEDDHEVNAFVECVSAELALRGHGVLVLAPSRSPDLVRESRRRIRAGELFDPGGGVSVLGVGELLPLAPARRGTPPAPPLDVARTIEEVLRQRAAGLRPRPRAVRAQRLLRGAAPFPRAQRRLLPRADRAGHLDPGRAPLRRALLRPPGRPHRVLRGHARPHGARLPRALPPAAAGRGHARAHARGRARRCGSPSSTTRSARRCGCSCARCAGCPPASSGRPCSSPPPARRPRRCAARCATA